MTGWQVSWLCQIAAAIGEDALGDADGDTFEGPAIVLFQVEPALEGVVDRLDLLSHRLAAWSARPIPTWASPWAR
ncbi:hypothetical protein ACKI1I_34065 [Streptomyces turgidiscabies]|nr:hypothetical protein T45_06686 [Streptomyces turgidiscabies]